VGPGPSGQRPYLLQRRWDESLEDAQQARPSATGWVEAQTPHVRVAAAMRNFWRLFPKEIEYRDGALVWHTCRRTAGTRSASTTSSRATTSTNCGTPIRGANWTSGSRRPTNQSLDEEYQRTKAAGNPAFPSDYQNVTFANAQGLCIHNDLVLGFFPRAVADGQEGKRLSFLADEDPHAAADPAYVCGTGVFGHPARGHKHVRSR